METADNDCCFLTCDLKNVVPMKEVKKCDNNNSPNIIESTLTVDEEHYMTLDESAENAPMMSSGDVATPSYLTDNKDGGVVYQLMYPIQQTFAYQDVNMNHAAITSVHIPIPLPNQQPSPTIPVSCGSIQGKMHLNLFQCPGIHQQCIEFDSQMLSPKQFTVRGEKEKQKDWKASIRIGKTSLRAHMEAGTIDFYDHPARCSGKCQSRNYVNSPQEREEVIQMRKAKRTAEHLILKQEINKEMDKNMKICERMTGLNYPVIGDQLIDDDVMAPKQEEERRLRGRPRGAVRLNNKKPPAAKIRKYEDVPTEFFYDNDTESVADEGSGEAGVSAYMDIMCSLQNDPHDFWAQMHKTGVISHFCDDIIVSAINLKQTVSSPNPISSSVANMLTRSAFAFNIQSVVVQRVQAIERSVAQQQKHNLMMMLEMSDGNSSVGETLDSQSSSQQTYAVSERNMENSQSLSHQNSVQNFEQYQVPNIYSRDKSDDSPKTGNTLLPLKFESGSNAAHFNENTN